MAQPSTQTSLTIFVSSIRREADNILNALTAILLAR
jgi:hypothetical protein